MIMKVMLKVMMMICGYAFLLPRSILEPAELIKTLPSPRAILIIFFVMMVIMIIKLMMIIANDQHPLAIMIFKVVKFEWLDIFHTVAESKIFWA